MDPTGLLFGYRFTHAGGGRDIEHIHLLRAAAGTFELEGNRYPKRVETADQPVPFQRDLLFEPRLVLYLNRPEWLDAFRNPQYPVVLGRSQDLFTYTSLSVIDAQIEPAYLEHTLLPFGFELHHRGTSLVMPRFIDYERQRQAEFEAYVAIRDRVFPDDPLPVDPDSSQVTDPRGQARRFGIVLHSFTRERPGAP